MAKSADVKRTILAVLADFEDQHGDRLPIPIDEAGWLADAIFDALHEQGYLPDISLEP